MFSCELLAGVLLCTPLTIANPPLLPLDFDLRRVSGSYTGVQREPAVLFHYVPPVAPPQWSLASTKSHLQHTFVRRDQYTPGITIHPIRMIVRFTFDESGTQTF